MSSLPAAVRIGPETYRVEVNGRTEIVYAVATPRDTWVWWRGRAFRIADEDESQERGRSRGAIAGGRQALAAPMPAKVLKVNVVPGAQVHKGETLIVLEAMKMELPLRAPADGFVSAINCRDGELVQPDRVLVELSNRSTTEPDAP